MHINAFVLFKEKFCIHIHQHTQWYVFIILLFSKYSKLVAVFDFSGKSIVCTRLDRVSILLRVLGSWSCSSWSCQEFCSWPVWEQESWVCIPCLQRMDIKQTSTISNLHKCALRQRKDWHLLRASRWVSKLPGQMICSGVIATKQWWRETNLNAPKSLQHSDVSLQTI